MEKYFYKVKFNYIKDGENSKITKFGFLPVYEKSQEGDTMIYWSECWAKSLDIESSGSIGKWIRKNIESIYKMESKKEESKWVKEIIAEGYEFDEEGNLIENDKTQEKIRVQVCIDYAGSLKGLLYINVGGLLEFYDHTVLKEHVPELINQLIKDNVIYLKKIPNERKEDKCQKKKLMN